MPAVDQPEADGHQKDNQSADHQLDHVVLEFQGFERLSFGLRDREGSTNGEDSTGDTDPGDDQERIQILDADLMNRGNQQTGDGAEELHHDHDEEDLVDQGDEDGKEREVYFSKKFY